MISPVKANSSFACSVGLDMQAYTHVFFKYPILINQYNILPRVLCTHSKILSVPLETWNLGYEMESIYIQPFFLGVIKTVSFIQNRLFLQSCVDIKPCLIYNKIQHCVLES